MCLVSPTSFNKCVAEHEQGRISTGKANDEKPGGSLSDRGRLDETESGKERHTSYTHGILKPP